MHPLLTPPHRHDCSTNDVEAGLAAALRLQRLLAQISSRFVTLSSGCVNDTIEETQQLICETLGVDRSTLWQSADNSSDMTLTHFWQRAGSVPLRRNSVTSGNLPWAEKKVRSGAAFHFSSLCELPPEAAHDVEILRLHDCKSNATFPLIADGKVFGALAFATVTVERQWTEDELSGLKLVAQIFGHVICQRRAEARAEQLRDEIQRCSRASMLGELAAALAHEINQPLTAILGNAQAARRFLDQGNADPAEIRIIIDDIIRDDKRASAVVKNLRVMLDGSPARQENCCLNKIVREVAEFLHSEMKSGGVELKLDLASKLPPIRAARIEVQQVLINLIGNAAHAMADTPLEERHITLQTRTNGNRVNVLIQDRGHGIPHEHFDRIFEPFHTTRPDGLGMGLAICRRIASAHGGGIHAVNHQSGGAAFSFSLPIQT
ncbi:MAG: ATP-binding protein [Verrucomicrobiota bacterium]